MPAQYDAMGNYIGDFEDVQYAGVPPSQAELQAANNLDAEERAQASNQGPSQAELQAASDLDAAERSRGYTSDSSPAAARAAENASMDAYNNSLQGPPAPSTTAQTDSDPVNNSSIPPGSSNSSDTASDAQKEVSTNSGSYTSSPMGGNSIGRIMAGMQTYSAALTNILKGEGYNPSKYSMARKNPLNAYTSFNCLFTLACLTPKQQEVGKFSAASLQNIICRTQGDWGHPEKHVKTEFGQFDYIIDDVIIASLPSMNKTNGAAFATKISFRVTEPYSLGLFFLALQDGANRSGYSNFREASYLLMIEFSGYLDNKQPFIDHTLTRYIPIKFQTIKLKAGMAGSVYECEAFPYNEIAFRDPFANSLENMQIKGSTVQDFLTGAEGLKTALEKQVRNARKDKVADGFDSISIEFPSKWTEIGDTGNEISRSKLFKDFNDAGQVKFPETNAVFDQVKQIYKDNSIATVKDKSFQFPKGTKIQDMISEVILRSDFISEQLTKSTLLLKPDGMINWFRIETRIIDGPESKSLGRQTRKIIYRIVPYLIHVGKFLPPNTKAPGYEVLNKEAVRVYEYLYTGQNTDIIKLDLEFNMAFFAPLPTDATNAVGTNTAGQTLDASKEEVAKIQGVNNTNAKDETGSAALTGDLYRASGSGTDTPKSAQGKTLEALFTNKGDLLNIEFEVRGDPYYLPSSGMGNIIQQEVGLNLLDDGSMNYQSGETDVVIVIRTPIDLDPRTGLYKFEKTVDELSGLFTITEVESKFNHNKFTQIIRGFRRRVQLGSGSAAKSTIFG